MNQELKDAILACCEEIDGKKRLPCGRAFQIAREKGLSLKDLGDFCEEQGIRISSCQLGCF